MTTTKAEIEDLYSKYKEELSSKKNVHPTELFKMGNLLRQKYKSIILKINSTDNQIDASKKLWSRCFYKVISLYRKKLKMHNTRHDS